ncbi:hypothetical protein CK203_107477 [Vitis vinifera]|uniref:Retrotransposon gag domain-containing protein n=1 Tax=Vitis vinifera TaxID=29760 RepID=A0A438CEK7_VITVI|nr:hypothetical protein CK203_107477 [Vitis vinifera]
MSGSNVEETSEQNPWEGDRAYCTGQGRKDKSRDAVANMEARLAKVELAMADTREGLDLIEQGMEKGLEDLGEQIQDLCERVLVSQVQPVSHEEFVSFQGKVLSMLASMESRIEALATRMESRDQEVRRELAIYKAAVSARVMATQEASRVEVRTATLYLTDTATLWWRRRKNMRRLKHTGSIRDYVKEFSSLMLEIPNMTQEELLFNFMDNLQRGDSPRLSLWRIATPWVGRRGSKGLHAPKKGSSKTSNVREGRGKAERKEFTPKIKCFLCDGPHWARDCPKRKALSAMIEERSRRRSTYGLNAAIRCPPNSTRSLARLRPPYTQGCK